MPMFTRMALLLPRTSRGKWEQQMATGTTHRYNFYKVSQVVVSGIFENTAMLMDFELIQAPKTLKKPGARARGQAHR